MNERISKINEDVDDANLWDWENYESVEPEAIERAKVVGGNCTRVPHEFPTSYHEGLSGHVGQPKLEPQVTQVNSVHTSPENGDDYRQPAVHVQARRTTGADG